MQQQTNNNQAYRIRVNHHIKVPQVRVIMEDGSSPGIMNTYDALKLAKDLGLDLVEINPKSYPPVVKIMNFGKFKYEEKKKQSEAKKNQKTQELKEITFRPNTDENDLNHKVEQAKQFLADGHKVKFTIRFKGREIAHADLAKEKMDLIFDKLNGLIQNIPPVNMEGKFMSAIVYPIKK